MVLGHYSFFFENFLSEVSFLVLEVNFLFIIRENFPYKNHNKQPIKKKRVKAYLTKFELIFVLDLSRTTIVALSYE